MADEFSQGEPPQSTGAETRSGVERQRLAELLEEARRHSEADRDEEAAELLGRAAARQVEAGLLNAGIDTYRKALALDPSRGDFFREIGKTHHQLGRFGKAFDAYATAVEVDHLRGNRDAARELLDRMSRLEPNDVLRHAKLAELLAKLGKEERALEELESCTDKLLHDQEDLDGFIEVAERILALEPEYEVLQKRLTEVIVAEARAYVRYNLQERAGRLLEILRDWEPSDREVRESVAELCAETGNPSGAVEEFVELARLVDDDERALGYLRCAERHADERETIEEVADELGLDSGELPDAEFESDDLGTDSDDSWGEEETDPERPAEMIESVEELEDEDDLPEDLEPGGLDEPTRLDEPTDTIEEGAEPEEVDFAGSALVTDASLDAAVLPPHGKFPRLLALFSHVANSDGTTCIRVQSTGNEKLGRFWVSEGRILPGAFVDDTVFVDDIFRQRDGELTELLDGATPGAIFERLEERGEHWRPDQIEPLEKLTARAITELLERGEDEELVVSRSPSDEGFEASLSFSLRSLLRHVAARLAESKNTTADRVFEAAETEGFEAWLLAPETTEQAGTFWLPIRATSMGRTSIEELADISTSVRGMTKAFGEIDEAVDNEGGLMSVFIGGGAEYLFVSSDRRVAAVRIPDNMMGAVLNAIQPVVEEGAPEDPPTTTL